MDYEDIDISSLFSVRYVDLVFIYVYIFIYIISMFWIIIIVHIIYFVIIATKFDYKCVIVQNGDGE